MASKTPAGLGTKARKLWRETVRAYELSAHELMILEQACRTLDDIERIEGELADQNLIVKGSRNQPVANELLGEIRQHRQSFRALVISLKLPDAESEAEDGNKTRLSARAAAQRRWSGTGSA